MPEGLFISPQPSETGSLSVGNVVRKFSGKTTAPTVNDDISLGYIVSDLWIDETADRVYVCVNNADGAAIWDSADASGDVSTHAALTTGTHGVTGTILGTEDVDDTPVDGATTDPVSSNWAFDHNARDATALVQGHATATQITALEAATAAQHARSHALDGTSDHSIGGLTNTYLVKSDGTKLVPATNTDADIASAVSLKHTQGTDTALGAVGTKNPPIDADKAIYRDSTASDALVTSTWTQVKAFLKTYFDTLYNLYVHPNHSGDITSVADGATTIGAKKVTIAMLADGTDGELITWGADGVATTVPVGTATHVLTSNGVGAAPTFQAAAVGGAEYAVAWAFYGG